MDCVGKKAAVIGLSSSGAAAVTLLKTKGCKLTAYDDDLSKSVAGLENAAARKNFDFIAEQDFIVLSPGVPNSHSAVKAAKLHNVPIYSELSLGASELNCPIIAVTGTNGKTSTVGMIKKLLQTAGKKVKTAGNVGYPISQLAKDGEKLDYAIVEASSFQLEYGEIRPYIACILNFSPDHLDRYDTYSDYVAAKTRLLEFQTPNDYAVLNRDDPSVWRLAEKVRGKVVPFSTRKEEGRAYVKDGYFIYNDKPLVPLKNFKIKGEHNLSNALCALTVGSVVGASAASAAAFIKKCTLPPHRIEYVATVGGKRYYNDSKGTNIHATRAAVDMLDEGIGLILGGSDKKEEFCDFFDTLPEKVVQVAATGANAEKILNSALKVGFSGIRIYKDLQDAVDALAANGSVNNVLFSPASASFDRFKNYEERGNAFKELVFRIKA